MISKNNFFLQDNVITLLDSIAEGVIVINNKSNIIFTNKRITALFGYQKDELEGEKLSILLPDRFRKFHDKHINEYFINPKIRMMGQGIELSGLKKDGTEFFLEISLSHLKSDNERLGFAFISDITARKKAEDELRERNKELDSFAHTVAHDLNSLLAGMVGFGELLVNFPELSEDKKKVYYERIVTSGKKMSSIIKELLFFASIKKEEVSRELVNMEEIISEAIQRLSGIISERNANVEVLSAIDSILTYGPWIEEVWFNLLSNAIKYGGNPPVIEIGCNKIGNAQIQYWIRDNGKGLSDEEIKIILDDNVKFKHKDIQGHGLGLSIVHSILRKLDGYLEIESETGKGSIFSFYLPK